MQGQQPKLQLSMAQILSAALASVSAAVVASTFGIAGTLIGAALTSMVATVGGALYKHSLEQAQSRVRWRRNPRTGEFTPEVVPPSEPATAPAATLAGMIAQARTLPWRTIRLVAGASALVFLLAMGVLTAIEAVAQAPMAELVGPREDAKAETTMGMVIRSATGAEQSPAGGDSNEGETTPTVRPTPQAPSDAPPPTQPAKNTPTPTPEGPATPDAAP